MSNSIEKFFESLTGSMFAQHLAERFARSWFSAMRPERRARMRVITQLIVELENIRKVSDFATGIGEGLIEDVIEGNWQDVDRCAGDLEFKDDSARRARYAPLWATFVMIARAACAQARERAAGREPAGN
jgi:hypothetical protein